MTGTALSFPTNVEEFANDDRISYSRLTQTYIGVHDDGSEFEFYPKLGRWVIAKDENHDAEEDDDPASGNPSNKRKTSPLDDEVSCADATDFPPPTRHKVHDLDHLGIEHVRIAANGAMLCVRQNNTNQGKKLRPTKKPKPPPAPRQNTAVYVTGLPHDATVDEVYDLFSKKGGVIAEEIDSGKPRIKLYTDEAGDFKGDALVVFFKPQSVDMAIMLLDETEFRYTESGLSSGKIRVQAADSSYKKTSYDQEPGAKAGNGGEKPRQKNDRDRQKIIKRTQKLDAKLADWDDDDPQQEETRASKVVILTRMFTLQELEEDPAALLEIKEDIREECEKLGEVTNVVLYDLEPQGIVAVKFRRPESADACVDLMQGRAFAGRVVEARLSFGKERFGQSGKKDDESDDEE